MTHDCRVVERERERERATAARATGNRGDRNVRE